MKVFKKNKKKNDNEQKEKPEEKKADEGRATKDLYEDSKLEKVDNKKLESRAYRVLIKPMVTEKATDLNPDGQYIFMVDNNANKIEVSQAVQDVYGVKPVSVNIIKVKGKKVSRGRITGKRKDFKKAIVSLRKGDSISVYEGV